MVALSFDVPDDREPIDLVREFAFGLRSRYGGRAGEHWIEAKEPLDGIRRIRVNLPRDTDASIAALWCLVEVNLWCLRDGRRTKKNYRPIYDSVCYKREKRGEEVWQSLAALHKRKVGDCEDLTCARVAERLAVGDACRPGLKRQRRPDGGTLYHVIIGNPDGSVEDPSAVLGMPTYGASDVPPVNPRCRRGSARA